MSERPYTISDAFLWALSRRGVTLTARNVLAALWCYVDWRGGHNEVWPSRSTLGKRLGMSRQAMAKAVAELSSAGLVTRPVADSSKLILAEPDEALAGEYTGGRGRHLNQATRHLECDTPCHIPDDTRRHPVCDTPPTERHLVCDTPCHIPDDKGCHIPDDGGVTFQMTERHPVCDTIAERTRKEHDQKTRPQVAGPPEPPHAGGGKPAEPLALIPPEQVETREPTLPEVEQVIAYHNERADLMNATIDRPADRLQRIRVGAKVRESSRGKQRDIRSLIADRIEEYGLDVVMDVVRGYSALAVREDEAREWYGRAMYTERSFAVAKGQVVKGTAKRFRNERERAEYIARHAGAHEVPTYAPTIRTVPESGGMIAGTPEWFASLYPDDDPLPSGRDGDTENARGAE
jgi:hypothetical protein